MVAIAGLLLVIALSLVVNRVATVILVATGMSRESARFQARSALSGAGFTTSESEKVVDHPVRRKVIANLMLLGSAGVVAGVSSLILGFRRSGVGGSAFRILELVLGLLVLVAVSRSRWVDRRLTAAISRLLRRHTTIDARDLSSLVDLAAGYSVGELAISPGEWLAEHSLADLRLRDEGIVVLGITRDGRYLGTPGGETVLRAGDVLVVYGRGDELGKLDHRLSGASGRLAHKAAVARQERIESEQRAVIDGERDTA